MWYKLIFCMGVFVFSTVHCAPSSIDDDYDFSLTPKKSKPKTSDKAVQMSSECITRSNRTGICVRNYQCSREDESVITDGGDIFDVRTSSGCSNPADVCCLDEALTAKFGTDDKKDTSDNSKKSDGTCGLSKQLDSATPQPGNSKFGEFPWVVALMNRTEVGNWSLDYFGVGTIIHPSVVLTIAHKFYQDYRIVDVYTAEEMKIRAGEYDALSTKEPYPHQDRNVKKLIMHQNFTKRTAANDIALLILESPLDLSAPHVGVACLADAPVPAAEGARCVGTGWGTTDFGSLIGYSTTLKKLTLPVLNPDLCEKEFRKVPRFGSHFKLTTSLMCAGGMLGPDLCRGDGGAPLSCPVGGQVSQRYVVYGLSVYGMECSYKNPAPSYYADVAYLKRWIDDTMTAEGYDIKTYSLSNKL